MKRSMLALTALAGAAIAAPAPVAAPAPAPEPVATTYMEPAPAPAPAAVGNAPYAPVTDALLQNNPAAQGSISSVLSIPHRWAEKRVAVFQWSGDARSSNSGLAYGAFDNYFAGFQMNNSRGDFTGGYTTPDWAAGLKVNFGKIWVATSDSIGGAFQGNQESQYTFAADGIELIGSYKMDPYHISGALVWRTIETSSSWQTGTATPGERRDFSNRYDSIGIRLGVRTYVTEKEGFAWRVGMNAFERYLRPSGSEIPAADSNYEKTEVYDFSLTGDIGYRYATAGNSQFSVGLNSAFRTTNGYPDSLNPATGAHDEVDYVWTLSTRPNIGILLPIFERWTLLGGAGLDFQYTSSDDIKGEDERKVSVLTTTAPTGSVGLRYAKDIWAVQAQVSNSYLSAGPFIMSGNTTPAVLAQFGLTVNLK